MSALNDDYTGHWSVTRQDFDPLPFVKLDPKRVLTDGADFTQAQVAVVCDFSNGKSRTIESTGDDTSWTAAAFTKDEIAQCVTFPTRHGFQDYVRGEMFATGRRIKCDPTRESCGDIIGSPILSVRVGSK